MHNVFEQACELTNGGVEGNVRLKDSQRSGRDRGQDVTLVAEPLVSCQPLGRGGSWIGMCRLYRRCVCVLKKEVVLVVELDLEEVELFV